ncbi:MAG: hypothetical protein K6F39_08870 [Lachnospiraceae bacterium]|nr:hypothetical protein [Lachnospiraceae bacterium]
MKKHVNEALALVLAASMVAGPQVLAAENGISADAVSESEVQSENVKNDEPSADGNETVYDVLTSSECIEMVQIGKGDFQYVVKVEDVNKYFEAFREATKFLNGEEYDNADIINADYENNLVYIKVRNTDLRGGKNILEVRVGDYSVSYEGERVKYFNEEPEIDYTTGDILLKYDCDEETKEKYRDMVTLIYLSGSEGQIRVRPYDTDDGIAISRSCVDYLGGDYKYEIKHTDGNWLTDFYTIDYDFYRTLLSKSSYSYEYDEDGNCVITLTPMCYSELVERSDDIIVKINDEDTEAEPILNDDDKTISFKVSKDFINDETNDADLCLGEDSLYFEIEPEEKPSVIKLVHAWGRDIALDQDGNRVSGFVEVSGNKYYANKKGEVYKNKTILIDGKYYGFDANGVIRSAGFVNGWDKLYYYDENGVRITDELFEVDGKKYYADEKGVIAVNRIIEIDGVQYYFGKDGAMVEK